MGKPSRFPDKCALLAAHMRHFHPSACFVEVSSSSPRDGTTAESGTQLIADAIKPRTTKTFVIEEKVRGFFFFS